MEELVPRLTVWEDAFGRGLVQVNRGRVLLTPAGTELLAHAETRA